MKQIITDTQDLFKREIEWEVLPSVLGSGYEKAVAKLAIEDKIAERAARKNMQIHSAVILKVDGEFAGFMTFQVNHEVGEFCLLQSVIEPLIYTPDLYRQLVVKVIEQIPEGYPAILARDQEFQKFRPDQTSPLLFPGSR